MIRLLVLDDNVEFYDQLVVRLKREQSPRFVCQRVASVQQVFHIVATTIDPFDIFLINLRLKGDKDGIQVMEELLKMSPTSDAIIKSPAFNVNTALRAVLAGATRYFSNPFPVHQLVVTLLSLYEKRRAKEERKWFKILNEVAESTQHSQSVEEVASVVVEGILRLGFERARLWLLDDKQNTLLGVDQAGIEGFQNFSNLRIPVDQSVYTQHILSSREPVFFKGLELGDGYLYRQSEENGFKSATGEWVSIPLWSSNRCLGKLSFDYADKLMELRPAQREFLRLFGKQVAAVLERAQLQEKDAKKQAELTFFNNMMQDLTTLPVHTGRDVDLLLNRIRAHVGLLIDVNHFTIGIMDKETGLLDLRLRYEKNQRLSRVWKKESAGFIWDVVSENKSLFLPSHGEVLPKEETHCLEPSPSTCWMGVPLRVTGQVIGAMTLQSEDQNSSFTYDDFRLLSKIATQVAGVIHRALLAERDAKNAEQLSVLHKASEILMKLAEEKEELVWHATLTVATAGYALRFNRAALFLLEEEGTRLRGKMAIGHFNKQEAQRDWERDERNLLDFECYLRLLCSSNIQATPLDQKIRELVIELKENDRHVFAQVLKSGKRVIITGPKKSRLLPIAFQKTFDSNVTKKATCAVLPIKGAKGQTIGLLVVDNAFNRKPIRERTLQHLEPLLNQAALVVENSHQRATREALLDANVAIMAQASHQPLGQTLTQICKAAQTILGADMVMIYPLKQNGQNKEEYDIEHVGQVGRQGDISLEAMMNQSSTAAYVKRSGLLVVPDVEHHTTRYYNQTLSKHPFIQQEQIKAFMGLPINDSQTGHVLGIQFFDYRKKHSFNTHDIRFAKLFANLAGIAIQNAYAAAQIRKDMQKTQQRGEASKRELHILHRVLEEALGDTTEERLIKTLFYAGRKLLHTPQMRLILSLRQWVTPQTPEQEPYEVRYQYLLNEDGSLQKDIEKEIYKGIIGLTLKTKESQRVNNVHDQTWQKIYHNHYPYGTQSELDVPIILDDKVIGVFNAESRQLGAFTAAHQATFERLAAVTSLALNNLRRQEELYSVLQAAKAVTSPLELQETLDEVVQAARQAAPNLSALTIWYRDPEHQRIILGPHFGIYQPKLMQQNEPNEKSMVWEVMHATEPIWSTKTQEDARLKGRFIKDEKIISAAAFPLRANREEIGAMFFNYRQKHEFTSEEKALFPLLAEIVADCVRDAGQLEAASKERDRLDAARQITEAVGAALDLDEIMRQVMAILHDQLFPDTHICISTYDQIERTLQLTPISKEFYPIDQPQEVPSFPVPLERGCIACRVANTSLESKEIEVINIAYVKDDPTYLPLISQTLSEIGISLMSSQHELLGVLVLESPQQNRFDKQDEAILRHVSHKISLAMERAYQSDELQFHTTIAATTSWAAEIAHDIRNEVGLIRNWVYWLKEDQLLTDEQRTYITNIGDSAKRLAWTGKSAGSIRARPHKELLIDHWLEETVQSLVADKRDCLILKFKLNCNNMKVFVVESALKSAVQHLVRNALEAMEEQKCCKLIIRSQPLDNDQMIEVQIEDGGSGVEQTIRPTLFQKQKSTKAGTGRGFGLLFTRYMIQQLGGKIRYRPAKVLSGSCFTFTLPTTSSA